MYSDQKAEDLHSRLGNGEQNGSTNSVGVKSRFAGRLGGGVLHKDGATGKRQRGEDEKWQHDLYDRSNGGESTDLRSKLGRSGRPVSRKGLRNVLPQGGVRDLREKLSAPTKLDEPTDMSIDVPVPKRRLTSVVTGGTVSMGIRVRPVMPGASRQVMHQVAVPGLGRQVGGQLQSEALPRIVKEIKAAPATKPSTVTSFLTSLDLTKYIPLFQTEEIDMTALRHLREDDLKEMGVPMGPRKKILQAISANS